MRMLADSNPPTFRLNENTGEVYLQQRLDYETLPSKTLSFQVEAYTNGPPRKSAVNTVYVQVQDINDQSPNFVQNKYDFRVMESAKYPTQIGIVVATDLDSGTNGDVRYSISGQESELFSMDAVTGALSVAENTQLDREKKPLYKLIVDAGDNTQSAGMKRSTSVPLNIEVVDENDNYPVFTQSDYVFQKLETDTNPRVGQVFATDADDGLNNMIRYSIGSGAEGLFKIDPETGVIDVRRNLKGHSRDNPYVLVVVAADRVGAGKETTQEVNIFVNNLQINDGRPRFIYPGVDELTVTINEDAELGSLVYQVKAQDADSTVLVYGFVSTESLDTDHSKFVINPQTGVITTGMLLDREKQESYQLTLLVKDDGPNPNEVTRRLVVKLKDVNDNKPSFTDCPTFTVTEPVILYAVEEQAAGEKVGQMRACDKDSGANAELYYYITCGNEAVDDDNTRPFKIDKTTGELFTAVTLDREQVSSYDLCVSVSNSADIVIEEKNKTQEGAADSVARSRRASHADDLGATLKVKIYVEDVDDNGPSYSYQKDKVFFAGVNYVSPVFTEVINMAAKDVDVGRNTVAVYSITSSVFVDENDAKSNVSSAFTVDEYTGVVKTNRKSYLDYLNGYFILTVAAVGQRTDADSAVLYVYLIRDSDRLKFVWDSSLQVVLARQHRFISELSSVMTDYKFKTTGESFYHVKSDGSIDENRIDLCFYMVNDHKVLSVSEGLALFSSQLKESEMKQLFRRYDVEEVAACTVKYTTVHWAGYTYLWWILVAVAALLFLIVFVMVIVICCIWYRYKKVMSKSKPYVVLDPVGIKNDNYEWQENTVRM